MEPVRKFDLSPYSLSEVVLSDLTLRFKQPLLLEPHLDESGQYLCVEEASLGIDVVCHSRDEIEEALCEEMNVLWRQYALAEEGDLTPAASRLRDELIQSIEEIRHAQA